MLTKKIILLILIMVMLVAIPLIAFADLSCEACEDLGCLQCPPENGGSDGDGNGNGDGNGGDGNGDSDSSDGDSSGSGDGSNGGGGNGNGSNNSNGDGNEDGKEDSNGAAFYYDDKGDEPEAPPYVFDEEEDFFSSRRRPSYFGPYDRIRSLPAHQSENQRVALIATAKSQLGVRGSGYYNNPYSSALGVGYNLWCADFMAWTFSQSGLQNYVEFGMHGAVPGDEDGWNFRLARNWGNPSDIFTKTEEPLPGDLIVWNGHIAMITEVSDTHVAFVGGNQRMANRDAVTRFAGLPIDNPSRRELPFIGYFRFNGNGYIKPSFNTANESAFNDITAAYNLGLIPDHLLEFYQTVMTRDDFISFAVGLYELLHGEILINDRFVRDFDERNIREINTLKAVHIGFNKNINPAVLNLFGENFELTRGMAAVMLSSLVKTFGHTLPEFDEIDEIYNEKYKERIPYWAAPAVRQMQESGIMTDLHEDKFFGASRDYTREQAIMSILQVFNLVV